MDDKLSGGKADSTLETNSTFWVFLEQKLLSVFFFISPPFSGRGASWKRGGETEADGGSAGGEEPGAAQGERPNPHFRDGNTKTNS